MASWLVGLVGEEGFDATADELDSSTQADELVAEQEWAQARPPPTGGGAALIAGWKSRCPRSDETGASALLTSHDRGTCDLWPCAWSLRGRKGSKFGRQNGRRTWGCTN